MQFQVEPGDFTSDDEAACVRLRPVIPINACASVLPRLLARELAGASSAGNVSAVVIIQHLPPAERKCFTTRRPSSYTQHGCIGRLAPIVQYSPLLPLPVGVWTVSPDSSVAGHPLEPTEIVITVSRYLANKLIPSGRI